MFNEFRYFAKGLVGDNYRFSENEMDKLCFISRNNGIFYELAFYVAPKSINKYNEVKFVSNEDSIPVTRVNEIDKSSILFQKLELYKNKFMNLNATPTYRQLKLFNEKLINYQLDLNKTDKIYQLTK